ncbi:hypothetical protein GRF29_213g1012109 [Pseudopithomyces chartarum]|uniref:Uncharacterized protein n=1 Tax=Pseudopithomyces chartarum TaxID=1892770 RepID=A0AAN6LNE2_9PLEO|nr:hypothetical protein GRF29_213g1012109 [Pseudopithomyces chartarum]
MRYALSGSLTALSFSLTNALKVDQFEGCATVVTHTRYVYATIQPSVSYSAGGSGSPAPGSSDAKNPSADSASEGSFGNDTADTYDAVHPSVSSDCSDSTMSSSSKASVSTGASAATGYWSSYGVGVSTSTGFSTVVVSTPAGSYAAAVSASTPCSSSTGIFTPVTRSWSSYSAVFANTSTSAYPAGASYPAGVSYSAGVSPSAKVYSASISSHANASTSAVSVSSGVPSAPVTVSPTDSPVVSSTDSPVVSSTDSPVVSSTDSSVVSSTDSSTVSLTDSSAPSITSLIASSLVPSTVPATATGTYGPNVIPEGHFDGEAAPSGWLGTRKNVGESAQSAPYVMSSTVTKDKFYAAHVSYVVGPLNWKGKYHLSFYHELVTPLPEDVECSLSVGMGIDSLTKVKLTASDASKGWQKVEVNDIAINSAINELSFDYYCNSNQFFEDGGKAEFWLDTVDMYEQIPPVTTPSKVCSTSAPTGTPGANIIFGGSIDNWAAGSTVVGWDWQRVTSVKNIGDLAHSSPNVLANRIDELLPFASIFVDIQPRSLTAKYTISFWVRFIYTNMPENSKPTLATSVGAYQKNRHEFKASDIEKGWTHIEIKDVGIEKFSDRLDFNFFDYNYPAQLVPDGAIEYWLDDVEMYEQPPPIVTCL